MPSQESKRLNIKTESATHPWKKWGPYVSERSWGSVREDYSKDGDAWNYFTHDMARSRVYRWGEDGIAGICDNLQTLCFTLCFWNGKDPILKERLFGLNSLEGNHGEDIKEYHFYLDSTPTHSYMKYLYKYPQNAFPYEKLINENKKRGLQDKEYELIDTGIFAGDKYFDIFVEYAKADTEDILVRIEIFNRAEEKAVISVLPQLFFRNQWSWRGKEEPIPEICDISHKNYSALFADPKNLIPIDEEIENFTFSSMYCYADKASEVLFTSNETNAERVFNCKSTTPFVKDAFHRYVINKEECINREGKGTKAAFYYKDVEIGPKQSHVIHLRLCNSKNNDPFKEFDDLFSKRNEEADAFYSEVLRHASSDEDRKIARCALSGMLWSKQFYYYDVFHWLEGDKTPFPIRSQRACTRNTHWQDFYVNHVICMPDKWEYPWFAAWDLSFHAITLSQVDIDLAKDQLLILMRHRLQNVNGQIPAYEWSFSDLNPPTQAFALWQLYNKEKEERKKGDINFLQICFLKLSRNFNWWVNKVDKLGNNFFEGGFLGLDNISVIDRSRPLDNGAMIEESDGTGWMGFYALMMFKIAIELSLHDPAYQTMAILYFEHFVNISRTMHSTQRRKLSMWDEEDGFFYDILCYPNGEHKLLKLRSFVGLIPLYSVAYVEESKLEKLPIFFKAFKAFMKIKPEFTKRCVTILNREEDKIYLFSLMDLSQMKSVLEKVADKDEFLSPYGLRSISKYHEKNPYRYGSYTVGYEPGESLEKIKGGNSNWRGPIWMPTNFLILRSLKILSSVLGESLKINLKDKSMTIAELADELKNNLISLYRYCNEKGVRPIYSDVEVFNKDPHWNSLVQFFEHHHAETGRGLGASHQTGWTGLVANLIIEE